MGKARNLSKLMSDNIVGTTELADNAVTTAKLANDAVTAAKLDIDGGDISYDNSVSGISATTLQAAIDYLNVLSGGGSAGAQATYTREEFTATAGQTTFTTVNGYTLGYLQVFMNGIMLDSGDYTANNESTVVLATGAAANDEVTTIAYDSFAISEVLRVLNISASAPDDTLTLAAGGKVGIGTSNPGGLLEIYNGSGAATVNVRGSTDTIIRARQTANTGFGYFSFGRSEDIFVGGLAYDHGGDNMRLYANNAERMRIDNAGRVTMPYQPSFFCRPTQGYDVQGSTIINGIWYTSPNGFNVGNNFNLSNGVFTAPIAGKYFVHWTALVSQNDSRLDFYLTKNGSEFARSEINGYSTTQTNRSGAVTAIVDLQVGDNVSFGIRSSSGSPNEIYAGNRTPWSYATGYLIG